jgi:hypothetical protein
MKKTTIFFFLLIFPIRPLLAFTPPTIDLGPDLEANEYLNASSIVGTSVDFFKRQNELTKIRSLVNLDSVDQCFDDLHPRDQFAEQISYFTQMMIKDVPAMIGMIGPNYGTSQNDSDYFPTSLIRHPLCQVSEATLSKTIKNVPSQATIDKLNIFTDKINSLRSEVINGDMLAKAELLSLWTRLFSCLAYTESLSSADSHSSKVVAAKYAPSAYRKPAGVEFYEDKNQPIESRLNIGTFQFTPNAFGNIAPCLKAWNKLQKRIPHCQLPTNASERELIKILGSSYQSFNAFCGVHKLIETFAVQVNTQKRSATHPINDEKGRLKDPELRCVSPHFQSGIAYNHFGPLQNSTKENLDSLFSCTLRSQN